MSSIEEFVLKAKAHQIFLSFLSPSIIASLIPSFDPNVRLIKMVFIAVPYIIWIFMLGRSLNECIPARHRLNDTFQVICLFVFVLIFVPIVMLLDLTVIFYGWAVMIPFIMILSLLYLFYFAAKALKCAEQGKRISFGEQTKEIFLLLIGYVGIWYIQPRINKLWDICNHKWQEED